VHKENVLIERAQDFVRREMQAEKALARAAQELFWDGVCCRVSCRKSRCWKEWVFSKMPF